MKGIKQIMRKMADPKYVIFKLNRRECQANTTSACSPFAVRFIADMYAGKQFKLATGLIDEHVEGEKRIRNYISPWRYI